MSSDLWKELKGSCNESELIAVLKKIHLSNEVVSTELDNVISNGKLSQGANVKKLELLRNQLTSALAVSKGLSSNLTSSSFVALRISSKVKNIDKEHNRIKEALKYVEDVQLLKSSILGIRDAMDTRDWERAAVNAGKARQLPNELINGQFAKCMVPTSEFPNYPNETLKESCDLLCSLFLREFEKAAKVRDMDNVSRYFRLFPLIGEESKGLDVYGKFICGIITNQSRQLIQQSINNASASSNTSLIYGFAMSRLFENIASIIEQHTPIVEKHYGKGKMVKVIDNIQDVADSQGGLIIDTFWDERRINKLVSDVKSYAYSYLVSSFTSNLGSRATSGSARAGSPSLDMSYENQQVRKSEDEGVDLKEVGGFVNEISIILNRWNLYCSFLAIRWDKFSIREEQPVIATGSPNSTASPTPTPTNSATPTPKPVLNTAVTATDASPTTLHIPELIINSRLFQKIDSTVLPTIESLAVFVFRRSVEKAFQLEELPEINQKFTYETPVVTSVVDDVMYILNTLTHQILSTGQTNLIKTLIANFRRILDSDFVGIIQRKLRDEAPKQQLATSTPARVGTPLGRKTTSGSTTNSSSIPTTSSLLSNQAHIPSFGIPISEERRLRIFLIYLNNLSITAEYTERILKSIDIEGNVHFENDAQIIQDALTSLSTNFKARCNDLINDGIQVITSTVINTRLRNICSTMFRDADYMLSPEEANDGGSAGDSDSSSRPYHHSISTNFSSDWNQLMSGFAHTLAPDNYNKLITLVSTSLSRIIEKWIWSLEGKVNELGAIRLDRDISKIIGILTEGRYKIRDRFVRVAQIVMIIGFDDFEDEQEEIEWVLSDTERQRAHQIRVDR